MPHSYEYSRERRRGKWRFENDEPNSRTRRGPARALPSLEAIDETDGLPEGDRWSTWDQPDALARGPEPYPDWLVTELAAVDTELGILKTGKEADVFLLRRGVPQTGPSCLLAAKRYRDAGHRMFHGDSGNVQGRRERQSRTNRAVANRTAFGREALAGQWAVAEFTALVQLFQAGVPVPYPVSVLGTEVLLQFIGDADGTAAPRLAELRPSGELLISLWDQLVEATVTLAQHGLTHGDLSAYNLLVHDGRLVLIDLPQVVDVVGNPQGPAFLARDVARVGEWFTARGLPAERPAQLLDELHRELRITAGPPAS